MAALGGFQLIYLIDGVFITSSEIVSSFAGEPFQSNRLIQRLQVSM